MFSFFICWIAFGAMYFHYCIARDQRWIDYAINHDDENAFHIFLNGYGLVNLILTIVLIMPYSFMIVIYNKLTARY